MKFVYNQTLPSDFQSLQLRSGAELVAKRAALSAIKNSLFTVGIYEGTELLAFGRVCGDDALWYFVCDVMVDQRYTGKRLEALILREINDYLREVMTKDSQVMVHVAKPYDEICRRFGFKYLNRDVEVIMKK